MTQTFQERYIAKIVKAIEGHGFEASIQPNWANTGAIYAHAVGEVEPLMRVGYDFQGSGTYKLTITLGDQRVPSQRGRADYFDFYHDNANAKTRFWECFEGALADLLANVE